jgi:hypothetical protein
MPSSEAEILTEHLQRIKALEKRVDYLLRRDAELKKQQPSPPPAAEQTKEQNDE